MNRHVRSAAAALAILCTSGQALADDHESFAIWFKEHASARYVASALSFVGVGGSDTHNNATALMLAPIGFALDLRTSGTGAGAAIGVDAYGPGFNVLGVLHDSGARDSNDCVTGHHLCSFILMSGNVHAEFLWTSPDPQVSHGDFSDRAAVSLMAGYGPISTTLGSGVFGAWGAFVGVKVAP